MVYFSFPLPDSLIMGQRKEHRICHLAVFLTSRVKVEQFSEILLWPGRLEHNKHGSKSQGH